jgi:hypothetical protein
MRVLGHCRVCAGSCCFGTCCNACADNAYEMTVEAPIGFRIGYVKQSGTSCRPKYTLVDYSQHPFVLIKPPFILRCCCFPSPNKHVLKAYTVDNSKAEIGIVGFAGKRGFFKNSQSFGVSCKIEQHIFVFLS